MLTNSLEELIIALPAPAWYCGPEEKHHRMQIQISEIQVGSRMRPLGDVTPLAQSMAEIGLLHPIVITANNRLVSGLHRLEAARRLGWSTIEATVVDADDLHAELAEIDENLVRLNLTALEKATHIARRKAIYEALHPEARRGVAGAAKRWRSDASETVSVAFSEETASKTGQTERTVQLYAKVGESVPDDVKEAIAQTPIADNLRELVMLSRLAPDEQRAVAAKLAAGEAPTVKVAVRLQRREEMAGQAPGQPSGDHWAVWTASIEDWAAPRQYDLIVTDPPYPREYLHLWRVLGRRSAEWLADGGMLVAMSGQFFLREILEMLSESLDYYWTAAYIMPGQCNPIANRIVNNFWKPVLCFVKKGDSFRGHGFGDVFESPEREKEEHDWQQSVGGMYSIISRLALPGQFILDPFMGSGTTGVAALRHGCHFHGLDVDEQAVKIATKRFYDLQGENRQALD
jgi:ParB family chromosome partitioning protein